MTRFISFMLIILTSLMFTGCGGGGGGSSSSGAVVTPPVGGVTLAQLAGTWGVKLDGSNYADYVIGSTGNVVSSTNTDFVDASAVVSSTNNQQFIITEHTRFVTPAPGGTVTTTYVGGFTDSTHAKVSGTYTYTATDGSTGSGAWTAEKGGLGGVAVTLADFVGTWAISMDGAGYAQFVFDAAGNMASNSNTEWNGVGSVTLNSGNKSFVFHENTMYTTPAPSGVVNSSYMGVFDNALKNSIHGTYTWSATNGQTGSGVWTAIKAPSGAG